MRGKKAVSELRSTPRADAMITRTTTKRGACPSKGVLRNVIEAACDDEGVNLQKLTVLYRDLDPYRKDTEAGHRDGRWVGEQLQRFFGSTKETHWRGLYYAIIMAKVKVKKPDGTNFTSSHDDWIWLIEEASKAARWLGYVPFDRIKDQRNSPPINHRIAKIEPRLDLLAAFDIEIPDDATPTPTAEGFVARQAFCFALFAEKASLEEICLPWAQQYQVDLFLGTGETSETRVYEIARDAVADGRPLVVFTATDCDPSGWQMFISIARKLQALKDMLFPTLQWEMVHVGLKPDQVREFNLPEEPIKDGDKRAAKWEEGFGVKQTEIDALTTPEMTERGILRDWLDDAIAPYFDTNLIRRVTRAANKWDRDAAAAVDDQIDRGEMVRLEERIEQLRDEVEQINNGLNELADGIELPEVEVPEFSVDIDSLDDDRPADIKFDDDWVTTTKALIARKRYDNNNEGE